jgi:hypothetical protein
VSATNNLAIPFIQANQLQKEVTHSTGVALLDAAITETFDANLASANVSLTNAQYRECLQVRAINATVAGRTVTLPQIERIMILRNDPANTQSVDFIRGSTTLTLTIGQTVLARTDGTANGLVALLRGTATGSGTIVTQDEGTTVAGGPHGTLNFVGAGVVATNAGGGVTTVTVSGGGSGVTMKDEGTTVTGGPHTALNFTGAGVTVTNAGAGEATINVPGASLPTFRGAMAVKTSNQSVTSLGAVVSWDAEDYDTDNIWTSGSPTRLTVPSGVTRIRLVACLRQGTDAQNVTGNLRKNGSNAFDGNPHGYNYNTSGGVILVSAVLTVTGGDYFEAFFFPPATMNVTGGSAPRSYFAMEVVQ